MDDGYLSNDEGVRDSMMGEAGEDEGKRLSNDEGVRDSMMGEAVVRMRVKGLHGGPGQGGKGTGWDGM